MSLIDRESAKARLEAAIIESESAGVCEGLLHAKRIISVLPPADDRNFMLYVEEEAKRTGLDPLTVLANEWAAHSKLKDESLWPDQSKLEAFAPPAPAAEQSEGPKNPPMAPRPKEAGE